MLRKCLAAIISLCMIMPIISVQAKSPLVIVIDPGHGGSELGANVDDENGNRVYEKNMNLQMAQAMYNKLSLYDGIKVYMTRTDDSTVTLASRMKFAKSVGCDVYYSLHVNAEGDAQEETDGVSALISKGAYRSSLAETAKGISDLSLQYVSAASNLNNNGDLYRTSGSKKYANGAKADYYYVVRQSVINNFVGFIIEHGFIDDDHDFAILNNEENLKKIGEADAQAVIDYYGLKLKGTADNNVSEAADESIEEAALNTPIVSVSNAARGVKLKWSAVNGATSYRVKRKSNSWQMIDETSANSLIDTKVSNGKKYSYRVVAIKDAQESTSQSKSITYLKQNRISSLKSKKRKVTIKWTRNKKATGYRIYYKKGKHTYYRTLKGSKKTTYVKKLKKGSYKFSVRAYKGNGSRSYASFSPWRSVRVK